MTQDLMIRRLLAAAALLFVASAVTAQTPASAILGEWTVTDSQTSLGSATVTVTQGTTSTSFVYTSSSGDSGTVQYLPTGGGRFTFASNFEASGGLPGGGNGTIDPSTSPWGWHNNTTGAGGTMVKKD